MLPVIRAMGRVGGAVFAKTALRLRGIDVGDTRLPLPPATDEQIDRDRGRPRRRGRRARPGRAPGRPPPSRTARARSGPRTHTDLGAEVAYR